MAVRYEDLIDGQEESVRTMLAFVGAPYDGRCLDFQNNRRYARTASYAQVTEKLALPLPPLPRRASAGDPDPRAGDPAVGIYD
jgi:hypothetical protein